MIKTFVRWFEWELAPYQQNLIFNLIYWLIIVPIVAFSYGAIVYWLVN